MAEITIRSVDLETTGTEDDDEVMELGWTDVTVDTETKATRIGQPQAILFRPMKPIPVTAVAVHHITAARVSDLPSFSSDDVRTVLTEGAPFAMAAHNAEFEQRWLKLPGEAAPHWICTMKCALRTWPDAPGHKNQDLRYFLGYDALPEELAMPPHRAGPDSYVTAFILRELVEKIPINTLVGWTKAPRFYPRFPLGEHRGKAWEDVPFSYLIWMTEKARDMENDVKIAAYAEIDRRRRPTT